MTANLADLEKHIDVQNTIINDRTSAGLSSLAFSVSTGMPDSEIRHMFSNFWESDFMGWCDESSIKCFSDVESVKKDLLELGLFQNHPCEGNIGKLKPGDTQAPFLLLQTVLAHTLCRKILQEPFSLLSDNNTREALGTLSDEFHGKPFHNR